MFTFERLAMTSRATWKFQASWALLLLVAVSPSNPSADENPKLLRTGVATCEPYISFQDAVDLAQDGDAIVVTSGTGGAVISGKSLIVTADAPAELHNVLIENLATDQSVVLHGLNLLNNGNGNPPLSIKNCAGSVLVVNCRIEGTQLPFIGDPKAPSTPAAFILNSGDVTFSNCELNGSEGQAIAADDNPQPGLLAKFSNTYLYNCSVTGGEDPSQFTGFLLSKGANGLEFNDGFLFLDSCTVTGGNALFTSNCDQSGCTYGSGGNGAVVTETSSNTVLWQRNTQLAGGLGSDPTANGRPILFSGTEWVTLDVPAHEIHASGYFEEQAVAELLLRGEPGDMVSLHVSSAASSTPDSISKGVQFVGPSIDSTLHGPLPASGELSVSISMAELGSGVDFAASYFQAEFDNGIEIRLSNPTQVLWADVNEPLEPTKANRLLTTPSIGFPTLQDAIDCANDGDAVLVDGFESSTIDGKSLTLIGKLDDPPAGPLVVRNLPANGMVILKNLRLEFPEFTQSSVTAPPLKLENCAGTVLIEGCRIVGDDVGLAANISLLANIGLHATNCDSIIISRSYIEGGSTGNSDPSSVALLGTNTSMSVYDSVILGGTSGNSLTGTPAGKAAMRLKDSFLLLSGSSAHGFDEDLLLIGNMDIWLQDSGFPDALEAPGSNVSTNLLSGSARQFIAPSQPISENATAQLQSIGEAFDLVFLGVSTGIGTLPILDFRGALHTNPPLGFVSLGQLPASGTKSIPIQFGDLGPEIDQQGFLLQALHVDPLGQIFLSSPAFPVWTDSFFE